MNLRSDTCIESKEDIDIKLMSRVELYVMTVIRVVESKVLETNRGVGRGWYDDFCWRTFFTGNPARASIGTSLGSAADCLVTPSCSRLFPCQQQQTAWAK